MVQIAQDYPFLKGMEGWTTTMTEYARLAKNTVVQRSLPADPRYLIEMGGQQVDLRLLNYAADAVRVRGEATTAAYATQTEQETTGARRQQVQQAPAVPGGGQQQRQTPKEPQYLLPADMVTGEDALMNDPDMRKAMAAAGWGKDPKSQAKHLAERLPERIKSDLRTQWRQGQHTRVRQTP